MSASFPEDTLEGGVSRVAGADECEADCNAGASTDHER